MKRIIELSQNDADKGPYDIVYTGGETGGCSFDCAVTFLSEFRSEIMAMQNKVSDCGYV